MRCSKVTLVSLLGLIVGCATAETDAENPRIPHRVVLQARAGAGGGNPNRIDMNGSTSIYVDRFSPIPLDLSTPVTMGDESVVYCNDGRVPSGHVFLVTEVAYEGTSVGDSNGHGEFLLVVAGTVIAKSTDSHLPTTGVWKGALEVRPGNESSVYLEVANSSTGSAEISGYLVRAAKKLDAR